MFVINPPHMTLLAAGMRKYTVLIHLFSLATEVTTLYRVTSMDLSTFRIFRFLGFHHVRMMEMFTFYVCRSLDICWKHFSILVSKPFHQLAEISYRRKKSECESESKNSNFSDSNDEFGD